MVLGVMIASLLAQAEPDAAQILKKVSETYAHPRQYDFAGKAQPRGDSKKESFSFRIAAKSPDKARLELRGSMAAELVGFETDLISVVDGTFTWTYLSKPNQYSKEKGAPSGEIPEAARETIGPTAFVRHLESLFFVRYREFVGMADRSSLLRSEAIDAGGGKPECFVIRIKSDSPAFQGEYTWWVDKKRFLVMREDSDEGRIVYDVAKLDEPIGDDVFIFKPPAGAKQVEKILP